MKQKHHILIILAIITAMLIGFVAGFLGARPAGASQIFWTIGEDLPIMPAVAPGFDCDDAALFDYLFLHWAGYKTKIMYGNLNIKREMREDANHVWVIAVSDNGTQYPYDYGYAIGRWHPQYDQYFEGYEISYRGLLRMANMD